MRKQLLIVLCVLLVSTVIIGGCTSATPTTMPSTSSATTPATTAAQPIELRFSSHIPPFAPQIKLYQEWADEINKNTNGQVTITIYAGGTLLQPMDVITGIKSGIADMAEVINEMVANERPLTPILTMPFMGLGDWKRGAEMVGKLEQQFPAFANEWKDFKTLFRIIRTGTGIHDKSPGSAVSLNIPDWYTSLDRGLVEGMFMDIGAIYEVKVYTLMPYHTDFPNGMSLNIGQTIMNLDTWNKLPPDVQKAIDDASSKITAKIAQTTVDVNAQYIAEIKKEGGHTFIMLTQEEADQWYQAAVSEHQKYLEKAEAKGLPAKELYEAALKMARGQ